MHDPLNPYKLIVMFMLDQVDFPLTRIQIFDFVLGNGYTTYFALQQSIAELIDASLVSQQPGRNSSMLSLTNEGRTTLSYFENRIHEDIKKDIINFFEKNELSIKNDLAVKAEYYKADVGGYVVSLSIDDTRERPIEMELLAPSEESAKQLCESWKKKNQQIYAYIMKELL